MVFAGGDDAQHLVVDVGEEHLDPGADDRPHAGGVAQGRSVQLVERSGCCQPARVGVGDLDDVDPVVRRERDSAPVGEVGHSEVGDLGEGLLPIERGREHGAGSGEERQACSR